MIVVEEVKPVVGDNNSNEVCYLKFKNTKRYYGISLKKRSNEFLLSISERFIAVDETNFKPNKIRIYEENLNDFFEAMDQVRQQINIVKSVNNEKKKRNV